MKLIGIYKIVNIINNKFYIGSSNNILKRFSTHKNFLRKKKHHSPYLQRAWNKYGEKNFTFEVIEYCTIDEKLKLEQHYINKFKPEYNISLSALCPMEGRKHSEKTIKKFKKIKRPSGKDNYMFGKKWTEAQRNAIIEARKGYKHSDKTKRKMSRTAKKLNRWKDLERHIEKLKRKIIDSENNTFNSLTEAAKFWNISIQTVCDILKGRHFKTRKGIRFKYV